MEYQTQQPGRWSDKKQTLVTSWPAQFSIQSPGIHNIVIGGNVAARMQ
jgi:hypothetical protein